MSAYDACVQWPADVLRQVAEPVDDFAVARDVARELIGVCAKDRRSLGCAAPQVGVSLRVFVARLRLPDRGLVVCCNPEIVEARGHDVVWEGCFSFDPDERVPIMRPTVVTLTYQDLNGQTGCMLLRGLVARAAQHEIDHLNGVTLRTYQEAIDRERRRAARGPKGPGHDPAGHPAP